jgi:hypothetical protein
MRVFLPFDIVIIFSFEIAAVVSILFPYNKSGEAYPSGNILSHENVKPEVFFKISKCKSYCY